jgi:hypothetical protein
VRLSWLSGAAFALCALHAVRASAYDQKVHAFLSARAYRGAKTLGSAVPNPAALRARIYRAGAESAELKQRFLARYPTPDKLDAWAFKELLGLNPDKNIAGLDDETPLPSATDGAALYAQASRLPDDDERNRDRLRHDDARKVLPGPLPDDPVTTEMGGITGLSSQAHAHYQLPRLQFSDSPDVLKSDPRRFAVPPTVHTFGADYAELYTELAALAMKLPGSGGDGDRLAVTLAGAAAHHVEDVANQIHAVQVGVYDFFVDAKLQSIKEDLLSVGGLLRARPAFVSIGIDIISNHHTLAEALYEKHLLAAGDPVAKLSAEAKPDGEFESTMASVPAGCTPGFARTIVYALADRSSYEGPKVYSEIRAAAQPRYSRAGVHFEDGQDPDGALRAGADLSRFWDLEARGARRSDQALAAWWQRFSTCVQLDAAGEQRLAEALLRDRLDARDARDARIRSWQPKPSEKASINWFVPGGYALVLAGLAFVVQRRRRRHKKG